MVAHSLHRHSESLVNELERVAHRVVQEVIKNQYSPSGPILARPVGHSSATRSTTGMTGPQSQEPITSPVTYEKLTPEHKQKYDEVKAQFEADLIGSFERTRNHGIRWKGFSPEGALDNVDLSVPSEERTRALR